MYSIYQSPFHPLGLSFWSLDSLAHVDCLWLLLHVCTFTAGFLWLTMALLFSRMACDTHLSQENLCILSCQVKQPFEHCWCPTQYLWDYDMGGFFLLVFLFFCIYMYKPGQSSTYSIIKFSALLAETFGVYFITVCTDGHNTFLAAAAEPVCILTRWPYVALWPLS